ncbi:hypothetical protein KI387_027347, partial [Taxus chinensis]
FWAFLTKIISISGTGQGYTAAIYFTFYGSFSLGFYSGFSFLFKIRFFAEFQISLGAAEGLFAEEYSASIQKEIRELNQNIEGDLRLMKQLLIFISLFLNLLADELTFEEGLWITKNMSCYLMCVMPHENGGGIPVTVLVDHAH